MSAMVIVPNAGPESALGAGVAIRTDLVGADDEAVLDALIASRARMLVCQRRPSSNLLARWSKGAHGATAVSYVFGEAPEQAVPGLREFRRTGAGTDAIAHALTACERHLTEERGRKIARPDGDGRTVTLVGGGVVNLITALALVSEGYQVTVLDRGPEPFNGAWHQYGCTLAGDDARMFSLTEMDCYNNREPGAGAPTYFRKPISEGGWLALDRQLSPTEAAWVREYETLPWWLAQGYNDDIFSLNLEAEGRWARLRADHAELFESSVLTNSILRLYGHAGDVEKAVRRHCRLGLAASALSPEEIGRRQPGLAEAVRSGMIAGGLEVPGFTVNVHKFVGRLLALLQRLGVAVVWNAEVSQVCRDETGAITRIRSSAGDIATDHCIVSTGTGAAALRGSACDNRIHGVIGAWARVWGETGLDASLKVSRRGHVTEDANVTVADDGSGRRFLAVGSGYGYVGETPAGADAGQLQAMELGLLDTARRLFPGAEVEVHRDERWRIRHCVRPWTPDSLGIFHAEAMPTGGLFMVTGGHNTGGFTQAPVVALAVARALRGEYHPMHALYLPDRTRQLVETAHSPHRASVAA